MLARGPFLNGPAQAKNHVQDGVTEGTKMRHNQLLKPSLWGGDQDEQILV